MNSYLSCFIVYIIVSLTNTVTNATVVGVAQFSSDVTGDIIIQQKDGAGHISLSGTLSGLPEGSYMLQLMSLSFGGCEDVSKTGVLRGNLELWDQADGEAYVMEGGNYQQNNNEIVLDHSNVLGLVIRTCPVMETGMDCDMGRTQACASVTWSQPGEQVSVMGWHMWIIIAASVLCFFILILCIPLICCCIRRSKNNKNISSSNTDVEDEYQPRSKSPMYDELSLPFIDASLPPTPKVGRIVNGLDILLGRGVSENSLVDKKSQVQW